MKNNTVRYLKIICLFGVAYLINTYASLFAQYISRLPEPELSIASSFWCISLIFMFGWGCSKLSEGTVFPSFTLQLITGIILHDALSALSHQIAIVVVICTALAAIILKSGGDDIHLKNFIKISFPTLLIAIFGYLVTFFVMFQCLILIGVDANTSALLSAIIGSTDPAALIPTLKNLAFQQRYKRVSDIAIAESAINDAVGAIFTIVISGLILSGKNINSSMGLFIEIIRPENLVSLLSQFLFGLIAGVIGWVAMFYFERYRSAQYLKNNTSFSYDFSIVLCIPIVTFFIAQMIHGNGFLAAFISGLLANFNHGSKFFHDLLHHMETQIESVAKPVIFMLVGPFVSIHDLVETASLGFVTSLLFIFVARPVAVFISIWPSNITFKEKLFLCAIRETGVIPVVLAVIVCSQLPQLSLLMPLTAWVVIWTLTFLPAITMWWAKTIKITE